VAVTLLIVLLCRTSGGCAWWPRRAARN